MNVGDRGLLIFPVTALQCEIVSVMSLKEGIALTRLDGRMLIDETLVALGLGLTMLGGCW